MAILLCVGSGSPGGPPLPQTQWYFHTAHILRWFYCIIYWATCNVRILVACLLASFQNFLLAPYTSPGQQSGPNAQTSILGYRVVLDHVYSHWSKSPTEDREDELDIYSGMGTPGRCFELQDIDIQVTQVKHSAWS